MMISQDTHDTDRQKAEWNHARFAERKSLEDLGHQIIELAGHLNGAEGIYIDRRTAATRWDGEACDYSMAVDALLRRSRQ